MEWDLCAYCQRYRWRSRVTGMCWWCVYAPSSEGPAPTVKRVEEIYVETSLN